MFSADVERLVKADAETMSLQIFEPTFEEPKGYVVMIDEPKMADAKVLKTIL